MKKMIMAVAIVCAAAFVQAATVGWSNAGLGNYAGDAYSIFIIGQNGVTSVDQITALLTAGDDFSSYAFDSGTVASTGAASKTAAASGKTLGEGTYSSFFVLFDTATPTAGSSQFTVVSGMANQTKVVGASTPSITFTTGNIGSTVAGGTWTSFGSVPEPTSGLLLLLGMAGLALKRKVA